MPATPNPIKNKQTEVGIKYRGGEILHSLAFFELNQGSYIKEDNPGGKIGEIYTQNGENKFKGVEYSLTDTGHSLKTVIDALWNWGEDYKAKLAA